MGCYEESKARESFGEVLPYGGPVSLSPIGYSGVEASSL